MALFRTVFFIYEYVCLCTMMRLKKNKNKIKIFKKTEIDNTIKFSSLNQSLKTGFCTPKSRAVYGSAGKKSCLGDGMINI